MEVNISYLPTIGEPLTIKSRRAGRRGKLAYSQWDPMAADKNSNRSKYRGVSVDVMKSNAKRIIRFNGASVRQKAAAEKFLSIADTDLDLNLARLIQNITKTLSRFHKEF